MWQLLGFYPNGGGRPNFAQGGVKDTTKLDEILEKTLECCAAFVDKYNVTLLLKGPTTIVIDKNDIYLINTGNSVKNFKL